MKRYHAIKLLLTLLIIASFFAKCKCGSESVNNLSKADSVNNCKSEVGSKRKKGCPVSPELQRINFYVETSASMGGYYNGETEFKTILSDLTVKLDKTIKPVSIFFIADSVTKYNKSVEDLGTDIATTHLAKNRGSELHKIFSKIVAKADSANVSVFVSDCILSFPDKVVKANPEINRIEAPNALKNNIFSTFSELRKNGQAVSIYAFHSKFFGTYYNYENNKTKLSGAERPFYVWVIGKKDLVNQFNQRLVEISTFKPEKSLHFGFGENVVKDFKFLSQVDRRGDWNVSDVNHTLTDVDIPKNDSLRFCIALQLDSLPSYVQAEDYLEKKLLLESHGCQATFRVEPKSAINTSRLSGKSQPKIFETASHLVLISVSKMDLDEADIKLTLPVQSDTWYMDWSVDEDKDVRSIGSKTFAFKYLVNGVKEAYETRNSKYIDLKIHLIK